MSFSFKWPRFSDQFHADAIKMLESALNKGNKPPVIADRIEVVELEMGTQPPELEIRDIGELTMDQFRGIFRLTYAGDAHIVLRTKVQANPLNHKQPDIHLMGGSRGMLAAKQPLVVPMLLRLSHFKLNSYVVLVVSKQKGITLVFKTDPLQNVDINSTFDSIAVIQKFIQREIEGQLRQMFREDLPGIIHRLSQQWVKAKVEAPYLQKPAVPTRTRSVASSPGEPSYRIPRMPPVGVAPSLIRRASSATPFMRPRSSSILSASSMGKRPAMSATSTPASRPQSQSPHQIEQDRRHHHHDGPTTFPEIENYDPTYGLRPEGLPAKSTFSSLRNLFARNKGLADLAEEASEIDDTLDETGSFDPGTWQDFLSETNLGPSISEAGDVAEYETVPAVGGGTITRPRVYHTQSQIQVPSSDGEPKHTPSASRRPLPSRANSMHSIRSPPSRAGSLYNPYFAGMTPYYESVPPVGPYSHSSYAESSTSPLRRSPQSIPPVPSLDHSSFRRPGSPSSLQTQPSRSSDMTHSVPTPPPPEEDASVRVTRPRRLSTASSNLDAFSSSSYDQHHLPDHDPKIVLRPSINNSISQLSTLSHSNHTLSPYTRTLEHFTVRSVPPREANSSGPASSAERQPVKARRKRIHRLGKKPPKPPEPPRVEESAPSSPVPPMSEFDASEMDTYFRARDDLIPRYPNLHPSHVRRRVPHAS
ncbi:hypothetical protein BV20DRAFT_185072 [Pilatotrama ljubarskyi]|nr:hypothetical protein BV20DRAFT_185072 [Pilatotrama ljubarskyi]